MPKSNILFLQELSEAEFRELVLIPLILAMGYTEIRHTHGPLEKGKDLVFSNQEPLAGKRHFAAVVKCKKLTGSVSSNRSILELHFQLTQALKAPFTNPFDGASVHLQIAYVFTPFEISPQCVESIRDELRDLSNRVKFFDGPAILALIHDYCPNLLNYLPDPRKRYLQTICQRFLDHPTLSRVSGWDENINILNVYTGGYLTPTTPERAKYMSFAIPSKDESNTSLSDAFNLHRFAVILADVGAGKTTLLQKFLIDSTGFSEGKLELQNDLVPLFIPLSNLSLKDVQSVERFKQVIKKYIMETLGFSEFDRYDLDRYILLFDGFDEITQDRIIISHLLQELSSIFRNGILITSRPARMPSLVNPFKYYCLNPFTDEDIKDFLSKWFPGNREFQDEMIVRINRNKELKLFCQTPLILTLYVILARKYSIENLPDRKTDIYKEIVDMLLGEWDNLRNVKNLFSSDMKQYTLEKLAFRMHSTGVRNFTSKMLSDAISEVLDARSSDLPSDAMFDEIIFRSSLIRVSDKIGIFEFVHLSFQEYFTAQNLVRLQSVEKVKKLIFDDWWRNTLIFYFGILGQMDGLDALDKIPKSKGLRLLEFLNEANFTNIRIKRQIYDSIIADILTNELTENDLLLISSIGKEALIRLNNFIEKTFSSTTYDELHYLTESSSQDAELDYRIKKRAVSNYTKILVYMNTEMSWDSLLNRKHIILYLDHPDIIILMENAASWVEVIRRRVFVIELLKRLEITLLPYKNVRINIEYKTKFQISLTHLKHIVTKQIQTVGSQRNAQLAIKNPSQTTKKTRRRGKLKYLREIDRHINSCLSKIE